MNMMVITMVLMIAMLMFRMGTPYSQQKPFPFLGQSNFCFFYDGKPSDLRRCPYTDEDVFVKRTAITLKNVDFCPAAYFVIEKLMTMNP